MKRTAKLCLAGLVLTAATGLANAATPGTYLGLGLGASHAETTKFDVPNVVKQTQQNNGLAGRIFAGYNFNEYFGLEAGATRYATSKLSFKVLGTNLGNIQYALTTLDLVGKAYLPLADTGVSLYGLGGAALVHNKNSFNGIDSSFSETQNKLRPKAGVGASFAIPNSQLTTSLEYSHLFGKGNLKQSETAFPSADLVTVNLAYNFG